MAFGWVVIGSIGFIRKQEKVQSNLFPCRRLSDFAANGYVSGERQSSNDLVFGSFDDASNHQQNH